MIYPYNLDYSYYIPLVAPSPVIPNIPSTVVTNGQYYVGTQGPETTVYSDSNGLAKYTLFYTPGVTFQMGCSDSSNSARVAFTFATLDETGSTDLKFILQSVPSPVLNLATNNTVSTSNNLSTTYDKASFVSNSGLLIVRNTNWCIF